MPQLFGISLRGARILIERTGLTVGGVTRAPSEDVGEGLVVATDPPAESVLPREAPVGLLVSTGSAVESYVMPELLGRDLLAVRRQLEAFGFRVREPRGHERARHDHRAAAGARHARGPRHRRHPAGQREVVVMSPSPHPLAGPIVAPSHPVGGLRAPGRGAGTRGSGARLGALRRDGQPLRAQPHLRSAHRGRGAAALGRVPRRAPHDRAARDPDRALPRGRGRPHHRAPRGLRRPRRDAGRRARDRRARGADAQAGHAVRRGRALARRTSTCSWS